MEPYNPNKSFISMKLDGSLLDKMAEAGIPLTKALQYFRDNPEGPASETLNLATDEMVPFKYQIRSGEATPASLAEEAVLLAAPMRAKKEYRVDPKRTAEFQTLVDNKWREPNLTAEQDAALEALSEHGYSRPREYGYYKRNWPEFEPYLDDVINQGIDPLTNKIDQSIAKTMGEDKFSDYIGLRVDNPEQLRNADLNPRYLLQENPNLSIILSNPKYKAKLYELIKKAKSNDELRKALNLEANNLYTEMLLDDLE
jgi:hypothetical protein